MNVFHFHLSLCLNTFKTLCMNFIYIVHIISMAVWFVHLGNHFTSSWVYGWISYYITKIEQNESFRFAIKYRPFMNDVPFRWLYSLSKLGLIIYSSLAKSFPANARPCTGLLGWLDSSMGLCFYTIFIHPWFRRSVLRFHLVLSFRWAYLRFILCCFILSLRKAYGRYILASKDFIRPWLFASYGSLWMNLQKMKDSHTVMYILENTSYIYLEIQTMQTFVHRHGTCLRASAFRELKILTHKLVHE